MKRSRNLYHYQYRKCKKSEAIITKNKLLDACLNGNGDIFKEIKKLRASKATVAASMDGVKNNISNHISIATCTTLPMMLMKLPRLQLKQSPK